MQSAMAQSASSPITEEAARAIGVDAYLYFCSTDLGTISREKQSTNIEAGKEFGKGPMNMFVNVPAFPPADLKVVVRINFDTLYSIAWLDLTKEPQIVTVPETDGRFYLMLVSMLDMWTDVSRIRRAGGRQAPRRPISSSRRPDGAERCRRDLRVSMHRPPTSGSSACPKDRDGPADYDAVHKIQAGLQCHAALALGQGTGLPAIPVKIHPSIDMKTPPTIQVDTMPAAKYFTYAAELLKLHRPHITDEPIIAQMKKIGIEPGKSLDFDKLDPVVKKALESAPEAAQQLMQWKIPTVARMVNGWSMNTDTMGVYGNYYLKRAIVTQVGLGANLPEDAIYPLNLFDDTGKPLDGANKYILHFDKGASPPVNAFWSITLYDSEGFQVANVLNRFAVSSYFPFKTNADGSLDLYFQNESPGKDKEANWLPAPKGAFNLTMRLYGPKSEALTSKSNPPAITKVQGLPHLTAE